MKSLSVKFVFGILLLVMTVFLNNVPDPEKLLLILPASAGEPVLVSGTVGTSVNSLGIDPPIEVIVTQVDGKVCTKTTFEGAGDLNPIPEFNGVTFPGWLSIVDADAGGSGNFAHEPSPSTIAFWLGEPVES